MVFSNSFFEEYKDMFNYYNLITKINPFYKLYFNKNNKCFCIVNSAKNNQICLNFNSFNINIINILQKTQIENSTKIFEKIDNFNEKLIQKNLYSKKDLTTQKIKSALNILSKKPCISQSTLKKIIEE